MAIRLPRNPTEHDYEDFVAAWLQVLGYFVETRLLLRSGSTEILELDVVASPAGGTPDDRLLVDAKGGKTGFSDLFKIYGWRKYLGIPRGAIIHSKRVDPTRARALEAVTEKTTVHSIYLTTDNITPRDPVFQVSGATPEQARHLLACTWYKQIAIRELCANFAHRRKSLPDDALLAAASEYERQVEASFFNESPLGRIHTLYTGYQNHPRLTGQFVEATSTTKSIDQKNLWGAVHDTHEYGWIQYVELIELRARINIVKSALDYALTTDYHPGARVRGGSLGGLDWEDLSFIMTPDSFQAGLDALLGTEHAIRIPYLLQSFVEVFGGFYREESDDLVLLSSLTGIPSADIPKALGVLDAFFPMAEGWFYDTRDLRLVKMLPGFLRGVGCFLRHDLYSLSDYSEYSAGTYWLLNKWHNALYETLESRLGVAEST